MNTVPRTMKATVATAVLTLITFGMLDPHPVAAADSAEAMYTRALTRERELRDAIAEATLVELHSAVESYEKVVRRFPKSGYCDNALWQGGNLAVLAFERFGHASDMRTAIRLFVRLKTQYHVEPIRRAHRARPEGAGDRSCRGVRAARGRERPGSTCSGASAADCFQRSPDGCRDGEGYGIRAR